MMKKAKKILVTVILMSVLMIENVYASIPTWSQLSGHHNSSVLLMRGENESVDEVQDAEIGLRLSTAVLRIVNEQNGDLYINVDTLTHKFVDKIYETVFLDVWDDSKEDWVQIGKWDFERSKEEEENEELSSFYVGFTVSGCELNRYYRARAMHLVQWGDDMEGKATETNGVLLTDHEV